MFGNNKKIICDHCGKDELEREAKEICSNCFEEAFTNKKVEPAESLVDSADQNLCGEVEKMLSPEDLEKLEEWRKDNESRTNNNQPI